MEMGDTFSMQNYTMFRRPAIDKLGAKILLRIQTFIFMIGICSTLFVIAISPIEVVQYL